jgi:hypothetical protein
MVVIPSIIAIKYAEFADAMLASTGFGASCKIVYTEEIQVINNSVPAIKERKVMNLQDISPDSGFKRGSTSFKTVENTEDITLRIYWDKRDFKKFGNIEVPDGSIMTIGKYEDLQKITRAKALLVYADKTNHQEWRFVKSSEPNIHGYNNNYIMCFWRRA